MSTGAPPSGVLTFLFTDIEGSTRRWEADADAMRAALLTHDELLRNVIGRHGGFLFSHTGDGVAAAFASPKSAVDAAITAQRTLKLPVRMGLATGEAEVRDKDYFGTVLNRAARVMAAGHGGQILMADSTAVLLSGVDLVDLGPRRLRDIPNPITVYQVQAPGMLTDFPPLRTLDASPGNLRTPATRLIGREAEVELVETLIRSNQLVTLTGVGGVGKTRLALEAASQMAHEFRDGVWVFEFAAVTDPAAVPDAAAAVLGITQQPGKSVGESVGAALEGRVRLLVFDNCEHVVDAVADVVDAILTKSDTVRILATSREGLGVADERLWRVPSLDVGVAAELFHERARSVVSGSLADESTAVEEVCLRLDGIPLAIELAASRMASMTAGEVRDRLDDRFKLLVGSRRGLERHQTLRHAVAWSYDLLGDDEKVLLERCSVFAGGFELQSACSVAGFESTDEYVVLDLLDALVRKSLLVADRSAGHTRYAMLETIRQYAEEQLAARGQTTEARDAHARHFAGQENIIMAMWDGSRQREAYEWFVVELANLRAAFRWAADRDLDVAVPIATYAMLLGLMIENYEPITWTEDLIAPAQAAEHPRLASLCTLATMCWMVGRVAEAFRYSETGQELLLSGHETSPSGFESWLAGVYNMTGQPERVIEWCRGLLERGRDPYALARCGLVVSYMRAGAHAEAIAVANDLIDRADAISNPWALSYALLHYGMACNDADPSRARDALRRGLAIAQGSGNRYNVSHLVNVLGRLEARHGDAAAALGHLALAIRNYHDSGNTTVVRVPLAALAALLDQVGRGEPAATIAGFASNPIARAWVPEVSSAIAHLREVLGDQMYESLARNGETMTTAEIVTYAYDQIDQARAELSSGSE